MVEGDSQNGIVHEVIPEATQKALGTIHGTIEVDVRVMVDTSGAVTNAELELGGPSQYFDKLTPEQAQDKYFAKLALKAARGWKFAPGEEGGTRSWQIQFRYTNREASASARRMAQ
jgi:outer membrane biosynthesis protein TonB